MDKEKMADRLKLLRGKKGISQRELSEEINILRSTYASYESAINIPKADVIERLAAFYGVSTAYLLGIENESSPIDRLIDKLVEQTHQNKIKWEEYFSFIPEHYRLDALPPIEQLVESADMPLSDEIDRERSFAMVNHGVFYVLVLCGEEYYLVVGNEDRLDKKYKTITLGEDKHNLHRLLEVVKNQMDKERNDYIDSLIEDLMHPNQTFDPDDL